ncbi:MAG: DUF305 domain-containing protein [Stenotrophobium sp.]
MARSDVWARAGAVLLAIMAIFAFGHWLGARSVLRTHPLPGPADIGFCQDMVAHHEQAVLMATLAMDRATPAVHALAQSILVSQSGEIGVMRGWLQLWGAPLVSPKPMAWMTNSTDQLHGVTHPAMPQANAPMPGMASPAELQKLWQARGKSFDILFMQLMTRHHEGGVMMASDIQNSAQLQAVRDTGRGMMFEQAQEIGLMAQLLRADGAAPLPSLLESGAICRVKPTS